MLRYGAQFKIWRITCFTDVGDGHFKSVPYPITDNRLVIMKVKEIGGIVQYTMQYK